MKSNHGVSGPRVRRPLRGVTGILALALTAAAAVPVHPLLAQDSRQGRPLSLQTALDEAMAGNASLRIASARADMASAAAGGASAVYWPRLDFESGFVRSNDPVFVFGTKLRQGTFSEPDFDVGALNNPDPINDWVNRVSLQWKVFSPADWTARGAAALQAEAAGWSPRAPRARGLHNLRARSTAGCTSCDSSTWHLDCTVRVMNFGTLASISRMAAVGSPTERPPMA